MEKKAENIRKYKRANNTSDLMELARKISEEMGYEGVCIEPALDGKAVLICSEEYYIRVSSYVAISIMLTQNGDDQEAVVVGFGGGQGWFNYTYGSNKSIAKNTGLVFEKNGFVLVD